MRYFDRFAVTVTGIVPLNPNFRPVHCCRPSKKHNVVQVKKTIIIRNSVLFSINCYRFLLFNFCWSVHVTLNLIHDIQLRGSLPKCGPLDFATKNSVPLFFVGGEALVGIH